MRNSIGVIVFAIAALVFVGFNSLFVVQQTEQALVTQFGEYKRTCAMRGWR